ncbi:hypothetical protein GC177_00555 [bacterium]|nr:hypothetical protein [bacterium]
MQKQSNNGKTKPNLAVKIKEQKGESVSFYTIGAAWTKDDGSVYIKLYGTHIINEPFYLYPANREE